MTDPKPKLNCIGSSRHMHHCKLTTLNYPVKKAAKDLTVMRYDACTAIRFFNHSCVTNALHMPYNRQTLNISLLSTIIGHPMSQC